MVCFNNEIEVLTKGSDSLAVRYVYEYLMLNDFKDF